MEKGTTFVGLDAHKVSINVAMRLPGKTVAVEWECANEKASVLRMVRKVKREAPGEVRFCYEAGPCGYPLQRWIREAGAGCVVVAPSLIPRKPGERIKTNRRDARKLADLYRAGILTEVHPPTEEDEAHVRRLMIEAAWHYRHRPSVTSHKQRRAGQPTQIVALADKAMRRLNRRFNHLLEKGMPRPKAAVAIARELDLCPACQLGRLIVRAEWRASRLPLDAILAALVPRAP